MMSRRKLPEVVDEDNYLFIIYVENEIQKLESWKLRAESKQTFHEWINKIRRAYRPRWVEESASQCWICEQRFTTFTRQHHCRFCGVAVCSKCSRSKFVLPEYGYYKPVKVCNRCADSLKDAKSKV
eukprot:TRINITY_DN3141_c0_g1_i16.p2 TRINITY_DN3141_c0_g1~~TRINITY_DN3141_c0_g1_i16.p2  ORF type:complete len:126 (+),score=12.38 TRINITY_DN3141_c0_g1_i16:413-790(+)